MSSAVPNTEPQSFTAGETLAWTKILPGYDSGTYTLKYALQAAGSTLITITATADGHGGYAVNVLAATTLTYAPGVYIWTAYAESSAGSVRNLIARGALSILPSPTAAIAGTHATRTLALIETALEGRIPNGLESTDIDGQRLDRIPVVDLYRLRAYYQAAVASEQNKLAIAAGLGNPRNSYARFTRVSP